jgi:large subunit ribosomal protein L24
MKLRREDMVIVLSGNFRGQGPAKIVSIDRHSRRAIVEGINSALKHVKRGHPKSPQGGRVTIPVAIDVTNLALHCSNCNRGVRVKREVIDGVKHRVCSRCKKSL